MSHIVTIKTEVRDGGAVQAACRRMNLPRPVEGTHTVFVRTIEGLGVQLPDWTYPAVCDLSSGEVHYDNDQGDWGEQSHLDSFLQLYAVEKAKIEARRKGHSCTEQRLTDGSIRLTINVEGAA